MKEDIETMIIDRLMEDIINGKYKGNDRLPSENELSDLYKTPRINIRKAYKKLEDMGYIYSKQGKGRYLKDRHQQIELVLSGNESFSKKMIDKGYDFLTRNIYCEKIDYDEKIYNELGIIKDIEVYKIGRLRIINDRPIALHISFVSKSVFKNIDKVGKDISSMFKFYKDNGYKEFTSEKSILSISLPTCEERKILNCTNLIPLLIIESNCIDKMTNKTLEFTKIIYRSDSFKYIVT